MAKLLIEREAPIGWLTFHNPDRRNAVTLDMWRAIPEILDGFARDDTVRVVVLRGAGDEAFVAGADISEFKTLRTDPDAAKVYNLATTAAFLSLKNASKPVVAMIRGFCFGGGCAIALHCDLRIAADDARFCIPAAKLGIAYGYEGVKQVIHVVGPAFAREMLYTARVYDSEEALRMGLVHQRVPAQDLEGFTRSYVRAMADNAPLTLSSVKIAIDEYLKDPADRNDTKIADAMERCFASSDYQEGYGAFLEKRKPVFQGR